MFGFLTIPRFGVVVVLLLTAAISPALTARQSGPARKYLYHFENPQFDTSLIEIEVSDSGKGLFRFRNKDAEGVIENELDLKPSTISALRQSYGSLSYLEGDESYQSKYDYPHLGTVTIGVVDSKGERKTVFNFTQHPLMSKLLVLFRNIATQELSYFRIVLDLRHYPLDIPKELTALESNLKGKRIPEPERFVPLLKEILNSEQTLLIAKRQAGKLLKEIEKSASRS